MANYNNLKATINANIKANGNEEITGPILNTVLNQAVTTLGDGWSYKGIATPSMSPGTPDSNVFYIATTAGTYTNFGSLAVAEGEVAILKYNGSWAKEVSGAATAAQVTQLGQEVGNLEAKVTEKVDKNPKWNLFDPNDPEVLIGQFVSYVGNIGTSSAYNASGYIPVKPNTTYYCAKDSANGFRYVAPYDSDKTIISVSASGFDDVRSFTTPANCAFVRVSFYAANYDKAQVSEVNSLFTEYNPVDGYFGKIEEQLAPLPPLVKVEQVAFEDKYYIPTSGYSIGDVVSLTPSANNSVSYSIIPVKEGDVVKLTGTGSSSIMVVMLLDADDKLVYRSTNAIIPYAEIRVPSGVSTFVINSLTNVADATVTRAENLDMRFSEIVPDNAVKTVSGVLNPNDADVALGKYISVSDGVTLVSGGYNTTGYVPVIPGKTYYSRIIANGNAASMRFVCFYFVGKAYTYEYLQNASSFVPPVDAVFARVTYDNSLGSLSGLSISTDANAIPYGSFGLLPSTDILNDDKALVPKKYVDDKTSVANDLLTGKKIYACGDSYTHGDYTNEPDPSSHTFTSGQYVGQNKVWPFFIGRRTGAIVTNISVNGGTMTTVDTLVAQNPNNCFSYNLYQSIPADVDYIIIKYGINDENHLAAGNITIGTITDSDTHTFYGAWNTVLSWLISNRPGAKIGIIVSNDIANSGILDAVEAVARKYGIPTLNEARDTKLPYWYRQFPRTEVDSSIRNARNDYYKMNASNSHPNDACQEFESTFVEAWIKSL